MAEQMDNSIRPGARQMWQLPVLAASLVLFGLGLYMAQPREDPLRHAKALDSVQALITSGQYDRSLASLNLLTAELIETEPVLRARHQMLIGDTISLAQKSRRWNDPANHQTVIDSYQAAEKLGATLDSLRLERIAQSMVALGQTQVALKMLEAGGEALTESRQNVLKQMIVASMRRPDAPADEALKLLDQLLNEPKLTLINEAWAVSRQAEVKLRGGDAGAAVDLLLRRITRLRGVEGAPLGELMVMLGRAYLADGDPTHAEQWFTHARGDLEPADLLYAEATVGLGRIRFGEDNPAEAVEHFTDVVTRFIDTDVYPAALLGKAESEARLGQLEQALSDYGNAVKLVHADAASRHLAGELDRSLTLQHDLRFAQADYPAALQFLKLQAGLYEGEKVPPTLLLKEAMTHERLAQEMLGVDEANLTDAEAWATLEAAGKQQVARQLIAAADAYAAHAAAVTSMNAEAYGQSLWRAGNYFDRAGQHQKAIAVFREFVDSRAEDPRRVAAMWRLGQAYHADAQFEQAIRLYEQLVDEHPTSPEAYRSMVPLARCYLARGPKFSDQAERVLRSVVTNHPALRPESQEYREALVELGQLYYRRGDEGDYEKAIERLTEVIDRYTDADPLQQADLQFQLADAHRKSVQQIDAKLAGSLPPGKRAELQGERARRLEKAGSSFQNVLDALQAAEDLTDLRKLYYRNSYFYRADCAYDLARYEGPEGAIALYEQAIQRYEKEPASLVAMIQIVNSYGELKQWDKARAANERARVRLKSIPDEAFDDPTLPMSRAAWQRWLEWNTELEEPTVNAAKP